MPEITLETVNQEPQEETDAVMQNDAAPAIAEEEPVEEVSEKDLSEKEDVVEQTPVVKKARGRPTGPPPSPNRRQRSEDGLRRGRNQNRRTKHQLHGTWLHTISRL